MSEQRVTYVPPRQQQQQPVFSLLGPINLGQHTLEVLDGQSILLVDNATGEETMQLDQEESYRLSVALQEYFREGMRLRR